MSMWICESCGELYHFQSVYIDGLPPCEKEADQNHRIVFWSGPASATAPTPDDGSENDQSKKTRQR